MELTSLQEEWFGIDYIMLMIYMQRIGNKKQNNIKYKRRWEEREDMKLRECSL